MDENTGLAVEPSNQMFVGQTQAEYLIAFSVRATAEDGEQVEMLRVAQDGFYVRGKKVPVDDHEAMAVYQAFTEWMKQARTQLLKEEKEDGKDDAGSAGGD